MNKERMGKLLRTLRQSKGLSLEKLSNIFSEDAYLNVSVNAISNWERGNTIPDIDNLNFLSGFYEISIDEILNGEIKNKNNNAYNYFGSPDSVNVISKDVLLSIYGRTGTWVNIYSEVKKLIFKYVNNKISFLEKEELNTYLSNAFTYNKGLNRPSFLRSVKNYYQNKTDDDSFWWNVQKLFRLNDSVRPTSVLADNGPFDFDKDCISEMEDWQKDLFLCSFPYLDSHYSENEKKDYLNTLLHGGAKICDLFVSIRIKDEKTKTRIIDKVEELYNSIHKPYEYLAFDNDEKSRYVTIPNVPYNRLIIEQGIFVNEMHCHGFELGETYELLKNYKTLPDQVFNEVCRICCVDPSRVTEFNENEYGIPSVFYQWETIHENVFRDNEVNKKINSLLDKLKKGELYEYETSLINGNDINSKYECVLKVIEDISYSDYLNARNNKKTSELIKEINSLSAEEIINRFFTEEK